MKINQDRIDQLISDGDVSQLRFKEMVSAFSELEQHRATQHERRWRKIADEGLPVDNGRYQFLRDSTVVNVDDYQPNVEHPLNWNGVNQATHWRPQDTTLPEADIDSRHNR